MGTAQLIQLGLALLPMVTSEVEAFINWLERLRTSARQTAEWTPEQDAAFDAAILAKRNAPEYQPDPPDEPTIVP